MVHRVFAEWPTLGLLLVCYAVWGLAISLAVAVWLPLAIVLVALAVTLHASLTHEIIHGHPTPSARLNALLVWPAVGLLVPYPRFRDTHLAHHNDCRLTDPYEDPESNYLDPVNWARLPPWRQKLLRVNNTLLGRIVLGPMLGQIAFMATDWRAFRSGERAIGLAWLMHVPPAAIVLLIVATAPIPVWAYLVGVYLGHAVLRIRTFLEHRAHDHTAARTVIIEDNGPLALLFLNNNLHLVHHMHPSVPWYRLPALYQASPGRYVSRNDGYRYRSYGEIFARHLLRAKDPVPHPLWGKTDAETGLDA
ncbi:MAG: fatty acid desaturase [Pseudomonadota bacterium]